MTTSEHEREGHRGERLRGRMELQQRNSVVPNVYEHGEEKETEETKTEDLYQCLQHPATGAQRTEDTKQPILGSKMKFVPIALIILLLVIILIITAAHYVHFRQTLGGVDKQRTSKEAWLLHENVFYLFWADHGDCSTAERFCAKRRANLATVTQGNMAWLQKQTEGKNVLVKKSQSDGSGDFDSTFMDGDDSECDLLDETPEPAEGWVCERAARIS
ncbi:hypothetical protein NFI96_025656 [Prochilodus magdalenae]|nr:hypothetical protein NFI96_025656 [Prochilodus magdalenae]